jgi:glutamine synthetase type III
MATNPRHEAVRSIASAKHVLNRVDFRKTHVKELFGSSVFSEAVQRQRLPKPVFKALQKTIKLGARWTRRSRTQSRRRSRTGRWSMARRTTRTCSSR